MRITFVAEKLVLVLHPGCNFRVEIAVCVVGKGLAVEAHLDACKG